MIPMIKKGSRGCSIIVAHKYLDMKVLKTGKIQDIYGAKCSKCYYYLDWSRLFKNG